MMRVLTNGVVVATLVVVLFALPSPAGMNGAAGREGSAPGAALRSDLAISPGSPILAGATAAPVQAPTPTTVNTVVATVKVGSGPLTPEYDNATGSVYVGNGGGSTVSVISGATNKVVTTVPVGTGPAQIVNAGGHCDLYVANNGGNNVTVISGSNNTVVGSVPVGSCPDTPTVQQLDTSNGDLFVVNECSDNVSVISSATSTVVATVPVGSGPHPGIYDGANGDVYVPNTGSDNVTVISGSTDAVIANITVGGDPQQAVWDRANGDIYVPNDLSSNVSVISGATNTLIATVPIGSDPFWTIAYDPANGDLYTGNCGSDNVSVISGSTNNVISTVAVGSCPAQPVFDSSNGDLYVPNLVSDNVTVISGKTNSVVANVPVGVRPVGVDVDTGNDAVYVPNHGGNTVSVIYGGGSNYSVRFDRGGLPSGTRWWLNLSNGQSFNSTGSSISLKEPNGTYGFTIVSADKLFAATYHGRSFTVSGHPVSRRVDFHLVRYAVTFIESGLPAGTRWWLNLTNGQSFGSCRSSIGFLEANGTYSYSLASANPTYTASGGSFPVHGAKIAKKIRFT